MPTVEDSRAQNQFVSEVDLQPEKTLFTVDSLHRSFILLRQFDEVNKFEKEAKSKNGNSRFTSLG